MVKLSEGETTIISSPLSSPLLSSPPPAHQNEAEQARRACEAYLSKLRSSLIVPTLTNRHERCCSRLYLYWRSLIQ